MALTTLFDSLNTLDGPIAMLFLLAYWTISIIVPILITVYIIKDAKKHNQNTGVWATWTGISGFFSFIFGVFGLGFNMIVLSIYFLKTNRQVAATILGILFFIAEFVSVSFYLYMIVDIWKGING